MTLPDMPSLTPYEELNIAINGLRRMVGFSRLGAGHFFHRHDMVFETATDFLTHDVKARAEKAVQLGQDYLEEFEKEAALNEKIHTMEDHEVQMQKDNKEVTRDFYEVLDDLRDARRNKSNPYTAELFGWHDDKRDGGSNGALFDYMIAEDVFSKWHQYTGPMPIAEEKVAFLHNLKVLGIEQGLMDTDHIWNMENFEKEAVRYSEKAAQQPLRTRAGNAMVENHDSINSLLDLFQYQALKFTKPQLTKEREFITETAKLYAQRTEYDDNTFYNGQWDKHPLNHDKATDALITTLKEAVIRNEGLMITTTPIADIKTANQALQKHLSND